jgi:hypothetical protein
MGMSKKEKHLFELFAGEYVSIIINMLVESMTQSSDTIDMIKHPLNITGYLTDEDDDYFYLGHEPNVYNQAVKKSMIIHLEVIEEDDKPTPETFKDSKAPNGGKFN